MNDEWSKLAQRVSESNTRTVALHWESSHLTNIGKAILETNLTNRLQEGGLASGALHVIKKKVAAGVVGGIAGVIGTTLYYGYLGYSNIAKPIKENFEKSTKDAEFTGRLLACSLALGIPFFG